jgi:predicted MPP superfamily phosphohydrolase
MRRLFLLVGLALFLAAIYLILLYALPIYTYLLPGLVIVMALDVYLWFSVSRKVATLHKAVRWLITLLYWSPTITLVTLIATGIFASFTTWDIAARTYFMALIAMVYICKLPPIFFLVMADITRIIKGALRNNLSGFSSAPAKRPKWMVATGWTIGSLAFVTLVFGIVFGTYHFKVRESTITLPELPASFDGLRIVQVSDIHTGSWTCKNQMKEAVTIINSLKPDLVFFTGDMVNYTSAEIYEFADILEKIKPKEGVYAILGNHDYGDYVEWPNEYSKRKDMQYLEAIYKYMHWNLLTNENALLYRSKDSIAIIGVHNWGRSKRFQRLGSLDKAIEGVANVNVQLLLSHDPSHWDASVNKDFKSIDITFSGHTHGFQIGIECEKFKWSLAGLLYKQWAGLHESPVSGSHPQYLYVNRGLGVIGYPGRIGIWPEITLIVLNQK